ncbi:type I secretion system permease/ATPase [Pelagibius sp. Alg239-R121]|uniref:type I secretion system permease/ATPase n=1 Tax=Pelagibius sp. Alg239-R121 TaxID=2993448 RepID=UPI0024A688CF|nr:type I secretion system permease/ATPase [Pelagibius sp. Alg239-R121]
MLSQQTKDHAADLNNMSRRDESPSATNAQDDIQGIAGDRNLIRAALKTCRSAFVGIGLFSCIINLLMLTGPLFMMQVYDRVLTSGSLPTLAALLVLVTLLYFFFSLFELLRSRVLIRVGRRLDEQLSPAVFRAVLALPLRQGQKGESASPVRDMDTLRQFLSSQGPLAIFDMPWIPLYLGVIYLFHPFLGLVATAGAGLLFVLAILSEAVNRKPLREAASLANQRNTVAASCRRNSEVVHAMGMSGQLGRVWGSLNDRYLNQQGKASDRAGMLSAATRAIRLLMQSVILAAGAWLAVKQEVSPGTIIAASIIMSRALAPIELAVAHWRGCIAARQSAKRLKMTLRGQTQTVKMDLPRPMKSLDLSSVTVVPPGSSKTAIERISFALQAGEGLGIIGPSASGKSTLARSIVGVWPTILGKICLDGASLDQWDPTKLGRHVGYLPQAVDLFNGTVAENIARFDPARCSEQIIQAAQLAGIHDLILNLPDGYDTDIGEGGSVLSAGQRQRVGLARALYDLPFLVVLDEPNANLDAEGEAALTGAIRAMRNYGSIVIVVAHRPSAIAAVDHLLLLKDGRQQAFGRKEEIMRQTAAIAHKSPRNSTAAKPTATKSNESKTKDKGALNVVTESA